MSDNDSGFLDHDPADLDWQNASVDLKDLLDQVDRDIKGWLPKPGDKVYGRVVDIGEGTSDFGDYPLLTIETPSGRLVGIHCFHTVLRREIERRIDRGTLDIDWQIAIAYRGELEEASAGKNAAHMYRVATKPPVNASQAS